VTARPYPLAAVLALRQRRELDARAALAAALLGEARAAAEREARVRTAGSHRARLAAAEEAVAPEGAGGAAGALRARARFAERLRREAARRAGAIADADRALDAARAASGASRAALGAARAAVAALERHREGWRLEGRRRAERAEEAAADELVSARRGTR
jgi:hypothetical protein